MPIIDPGHSEAAATVFSWLPTKSWAAPSLTVVDRGG
jgi:hypothetical protein